MKSKLYHKLKKMLPPSVKRPFRELYYRAQGVRTTPLTHEEIAALIKTECPVILEIGCNDGSDTRAFLRVTPHAKVYCFEPDPRAVRRFKENLGSQIDKVRLFEIALSDRTGQIDFHLSSSGGDLPDGWDQSGSIRPPKNHLIEFPWCTFEKTISVSTCRLDDWCAEHEVSHVEFIWMDVQGAEGDVIVGAQNILKETKFVYTEYSNKELYEGQPTLKSLLALLPTFDVIARYPGDVLLRNRDIT